MSHIRIINGTEHWDLGAEEIVAEAAIDKAPVRWHFRPYAAAAAKALLKAVAQKYTIVSGQISDVDSADPAAFGAFFDAHFLRMSDVYGPDGNELSVEEQLAWLADNPQVKMAIVNLLFRSESAEVSEDSGNTREKAVLTRSTVAESSQKMKSWHNGASLELTITHRLHTPLAKDRLEYDRSLTRSRIDRRKNSFQIRMDFDLVESMYDRLVVSLDRACLGENLCTEANKIEWLPRVPFLWKSFAIEDVFNRDRIKNE